MTNIKKLLSVLVERCIISDSVNGLMLEFFRKELQTQRDITDNDVSEIADAISAMKFGTGLNLGDEWLKDEYKEQSNRLLVTAVMSRATAPLDCGKIFAIYLEICYRFQFMQAS